MGEPLFVSQTKLEEWIVDGSVTFDDNVLTILEHNASYAMVPAAKVTMILDGDDIAGLLNKIWTITALEAKGAEYMHDSIILGDTAYQCEPGFVGNRSASEVPAPDPEPIALTDELPPPLPNQRKSTDPTPVVPPPPAAAQAPEAKPKAADAGESNDMDLLTDFMLKNL